MRFRRCKVAQIGDGTMQATTRYAWVPVDRARVGMVVSLSCPVHLRPELGHQSPDLRLGQLVNGVLGDVTLHPWHVEDDLAERKIDAAIAGGISAAQGVR